MDLCNGLLKSPYSACLTAVLRIVIPQRPHKESEIKWTQASQPCFLLTERMKNDGYNVISGPRTTGDGYYESCIIGIEGNQIEITA